MHWRRDHGTPATGQGRRVTQPTDLPRTCGKQQHQAGADKHESALHRQCNLGKPRQALWGVGGGGAAWLVAVCRQASRPETEQNGLR